MSMSVKSLQKATETGEFVEARPGSSWKRKVSKAAWLQKTRAYGDCVGLSRGASRTCLEIAWFYPPLVLDWFHWKNYFIWESFKSDHTVWVSPMAREHSWWHKCGHGGNFCEPTVFWVFIIVHPLPPFGYMQTHTLFLFSWLSKGDLG